MARRPSSSPRVLLLLRLMRMGVPMTVRLLVLAAAWPVVARQHRAMAAAADAVADARGAHFCAGSSDCARKRTPLPPLRTPPPISRSSSSCAAPPAVRDHPLM